MKSTKDNHRNILNDDSLPIKIMKHETTKTVGKIMVDYCRKCKFWGGEFFMPTELPDEAKEQLKGKYRHCNHDDCPVVASPENFGCVLWKGYSRRSTD